METDTTELDMRELHDAANIVRHVAQRRYDQGHDVHALNVLADCIMRMVHAVAGVRSEELQ